MSNKQHYFLVSGTVYVAMTNPDNPEEHGVMPVPIHCTVFNAKSPNFGIEMMKQAHMAMQVQYRHKTGDHTGAILDVVFGAISPLGYMTAEEFQHCEAPTKEAVADVQSLIDRKAVTRENKRKPLGRK